MAIRRLGTRIPFKQEGIVTRAYHGGRPLGAFVRCAGIVALLVSAAGCARAFGGGGAPQPRAVYERSLERARLADSALGRDWLGAGARALTDAPAIRLPYRESVYVSPEQPAALAWRLELRKGQRLSARAEVQSASKGDVFLDVFEVRGDGRVRLIHSARAVTPEIDLLFEKDGTYLLRMQPELLRGGRYTIALEARAALVWPVFGRDRRALLSIYGDDRDSGVRAHEGIDIGAPRGTPAIASSDGTIERVQSTPVGGKVVWLRDAARGVSLYYAHLDAQLVNTGQVVRQGDVLGLVGNTGNARGASPHLHFGVYVGGNRASDPLQYLAAATVLAPVAPIDTLLVGGLARITRMAVRLRLAPDEASAVLAQLERSTALRVMGGTAGWYRIVLPDGRTGFVSTALMEAPDPPLRSDAVRADVNVQDAPRGDAALIDTLPVGTPLPVLARFGQYLWVQMPDGRLGWVTGQL
jgi:murein DD-endopeptidase MepM/ murein hydrolase activator NlpD/SH3-like domain-containing protein